MNAYGAKDLARSFRTVRKNTIKIAEEIPEEQYGFRPAPAARSVAELLAHIVVSPRWEHDIHKAGLKTVSFDGFEEIWAQFEAAEKALKTKAQILEALRTEGETFASWMETLPDAVLDERVTFPPNVDPPSKTRFEMLLSVKEHEMHHRGQLMVAQRMLGLVPHLTREMEAMVAEMMKPKVKQSGA